MRARVVDGRGSAAPGLHESVEVFGRADLDCRIQVESRSRRVRPGVQLVPDRAFDEVNRVCAAQDPGRAAYPEQPAVGVPHSHHAVAVHRSTSKYVVQQRKHPRQTMGRPVLQEVRGTQQHRSHVRVGVDPGRRRPDPRLGDHAAHAGRQLPRLQVHLALAMPGAGLSLDASHHTSEARRAPTAKGWSQRISLPDIPLFPGFLPQDRVKPRPACTVVLAEVAARRSSITQIVARRRLRGSVARRPPQPHPVGAVRDRPRRRVHPRRLRGRKRSVAGSSPETRQSLRLSSALSRRSRSR